MHSFLKFIFGMKLYMFRRVPLSIIGSSSLYTQQWYMSYRFAAPSLHFTIIHVCTNFERWSPRGQNFVRWGLILVGPHYETRLMSPLSLRWFLDFGKFMNPFIAYCYNNNRRETTFGYIQTYFTINFTVSPCIFYIVLICTNVCTCIYEYNIT